MTLSLFVFSVFSFPFSTPKKNPCGQEGVQAVVAIGQDLSELCELKSVEDLLFAKKIAATGDGLLKHTGKNHVKTHENTQQVQHFMYVYTLHIIHHIIQFYTVVYHKNMITTTSCSWFLFEPWHTIIILHRMLCQAGFSGEEKPFDGSSLDY